MSIDPMMISYEILKQNIKQYEVQEQINFDYTLNDLRRNGFNSNKSNIYEGNVFQSKNSGPFRVTEYFNYDKIAIIFLNSGYQMIARANNIQKGEVKDPYAVSIMGVGYIGVGPYKTDDTVFNRMVYSRWRGILDRIFIKKEGRKTLASEWRNFQYFAAWFYSEFYEVPYISMYDMVVDKDLLYPRNEEYGPNKCIILPSFINTKIQLKEYDRALIERFYIQNLSHLELMNLLRRKARRESTIQQLGDKYRDILPFHVYNALKNYKMF